MSAPAEPGGAGAAIVRWLPAVPGVPLAESPQPLPGQTLPRAMPPAAPETAERAPVRLWTLPESAVRAFAARLGGAEALTPHERSRMMRLRPPRARLRYLGARLLCRYALSEVAGGDLADWRFVTGPHGKPEVAAVGGGPRFNLSGTSGMLACVVCPDRACGVDVERIPAPPDTLRALPPFFAPAERRALDALRPGPRGVQVMRYWVLKEAYLKGLGTGLHRALNGFAFSPPHRPPIWVSDPPGRIRPDWHFSLVSPGPHHLVAVAVEEPQPEAPRLTRLTRLTG